MVRNTKYFHRIAKIKVATKNISSLIIDGNLISDVEVLIHVIISRIYYLMWEQL